MDKKSKKHYLIEFPSFQEPDGTLSYLEAQKHIPFIIKRIFYIYNVPKIAVRGEHAHKNNHEVIIAITGSINIRISDGENEFKVVLNKPNKGLYIPPNMWVEITNFKKKSVCLVLNSENYNEDDYLYTKQEFLDNKKGNK